MWLALAYADGDGNRNGNGNGNWDAIWDTNSHAKCHCHIDAVRRKMYSDAAASPDTSASSIAAVVASLCEARP